MFKAQTWLASDFLQPRIKAIWEGWKIPDVWDKGYISEDPLERNLDILQYMERDNR